MSDLNGRAGSAEEVIVESRNNVTELSRYDHRWTGGGGVDQKVPGVQVR